MWKRLLIFERIWLFCIFWGVYGFESASKIPSPVEIIAVATDELLRGLTNKSVADIAKEIGESFANAETRTRVLTDVPLGGHKLVELIEDVNGTLLDCHYLGDKDLIKMVLTLVPESIVTTVYPTEIDDFLDICEGRDPSSEKTGLKSIFDFIGDLLNSLLIFPGTKWCGAGDIAKNYDDLGRLNGTDACCREHDHSGNYIGAFQEKYGLRNPQPYTMTECVYDDKFFGCLLNVSGEGSEIVGTLFFNVLKTSCFEYEHPKKCVEKKPISIPILTDNCEEYELDTSKPKEWQIFPPKDFVEAVKEEKEESQTSASV